MFFILKQSIPIRNQNNTKAVKKKKYHFTLDPNLQPIKNLEINENTKNTIFFPLQNHFVKFQTHDLKPSCHFIEHAAFIQAVSVCLPLVS